MCTDLMLKVGREFSKQDFGFLQVNGSMAELRQPCDREQAGASGLGCPSLNECRQDGKSRGDDAMSNAALKVTVMGPGGVGGYFGARLAAAGNDVTFVARGAHLEAMRTRGLRLDSEIGPLHLQKVRAVADARQVQAADAVIFSVKMRDTETAAESLRGLAANGATVFTFQNGVESAGRVGAILGADRVVQGTARIGASISEPGVIKQIGTFARLDFGERDGRPSARTTAFPRPARQLASTRICRTISSARCG